MPVLVTLGGIALGAGIGGAWLTTRGGPLGMFGGRGTNILVANNTGEDITFDQGSAACEWGRYDPAAPTTPLPGKAEDGTMSWYKFGTDSNGASASCGGKFVSSVRCINHRLTACANAVRYSAQTRADMMAAVLAASVLRMANRVARSTRSTRTTPTWVTTT